MKDIRFCELADGRVAVFSRPQGVKGGKGKIGFCVAPRSMPDRGDDPAEAPLLEGQFAAGEWGGANEVQVLADGSLGVLGHIARWGATGCRHYYPMAFTLDPDSLCTTPIRIIATRDLFPAAATKRADLVDVVFSGGLRHHANGYATLWAGLSDAAAGTIRLEIHSRPPSSIRSKRGHERVKNPGMPQFQIVSPYKPQGDQPQAIDKLVQGSGAAACRFRR